MLEQLFFSGLPDLQQGLGHLGRALRNAYTTFGQKCFLAGCIPLASGDDGAGVTHAFAGWCRCTGDKRRHWFGHMIFDVLGCLLFSVATDLSDHDDCFGGRVIFKHFQHIEMAGPIDRVSTDTDAGGLADVTGGQLPIP